MTIRDDALRVIATDPAVRVTFAAASAGDRPMLWAALDLDNNVLTTSAGSPNQALWACFVRHEGMEDVPVPSELKAAMPGCVQREFTELGRRSVPVILPILYAETSQ